LIRRRGNCPNIRASLLHNACLATMQIDAQTYQVRADGAEVFPVLKPRRSA
jgi:urease alpha subunit